MSIVTGPGHQQHPLEGCRESMMHLDAEIARPHRLNLSLT
jgi:hypothetical protein